MAQPPEEQGSSPNLDEFLTAPPRDLGRWAWLWQGDHRFPLRSHRGGLVGRLTVWFKRLLRPLVRMPVADLWDRQRTYNLIIAETLEQARRERHDLATQVVALGQHLDQIHSSHQSAIEAHAGRLENLDVRTTTAMEEVMRHNDALFARVDQRLDRYRRETRRMWGELGALVAALETAEHSGESAPVADRDEELSQAAIRTAAEVQREQSYLELERRYRGSETEIAERVAAYLPYLEGKSPLLDLGCGRGEAIKVFSQQGLEARGVDASSEMVARCREQGLQAEQGDLFSYLSAVAPGSLGAVVSFHVIEHLPEATHERLVRLAWRALRPGGVLVLETPSPLSLAMSAGAFWIDPTHRRPVHPASLEVLYRQAGFEPVHRIDLHPFPNDERLPEIDVGALQPSQQHLADQINRLRDVLDDLLFGDRDFGLVGHKS